MDEYVGNIRRTAKRTAGSKRRMETPLATDLMRPKGWRQSCAPTISSPGSQNRHAPLSDASVKSLPSSLLQQDEDRRDVCNSAQHRLGQTAFLEFNKMSGG
jgi:hypothetical protein